MNISESGVLFIKSFESLRLLAYQCPSARWTIGYGHTDNVKPGDEITKTEADYLLRSDIAEAENVVTQYITVPLTQQQFDALVSFVFNIGSSNFRSSTLLKKLNAGDYTGAADELLRWINAGGRRLPGLIRRREAERILFLSEAINARKHASVNN